MFPEQHLCASCETLLDEAANAMRRHRRMMDTAFYLLRTDNASTPEQRKEFRANLAQSLNEAEAAWDRYREHLRERGLPPQAQI